MRRFFTFLLSVLLVTTLSAQKPEAYLKKASVEPVVGGDIDAVWSEADAIVEFTPYTGENPDLGEPGETYWKGLWTSKGIYFLVYIADDDYYPYYQRVDATQTQQYTFDQVELYLDCNYVKADARGGTPNGNRGHYQIAPATGPASAAGWDDGVARTDYQTAKGIVYSINAAGDPKYFVEYFAPWGMLKDQAGLLVDATVGIGFDVCIIDNDEPGGNANRNRLMWSNIGTINENYSNMDEAGIIYLEGYEQVYIDQITLTGGDITSDNQTLQIGVEITSTDPPNPPTDPTIKWIIVESTARYTLSATGLLTPISDGTITLYATSLDEIAVSNEITINISNQMVTVHEASYIVDGYFNAPQASGRPGTAWPTSDGYGTHTAWVEDGVFRFHSDSVLANGYNMKVRQNVSVTRIFPKKDTEFKAAWKMWSAEPTTFQLVLEQRSAWAHWGSGETYSTPNAEVVAGQTRWNLTVTPEPTWFVIKFIPSGILSTQTPDFGFQVGKVGANSIYLDSLYLIEMADSAIINWDHVVGVNQSKQLETLNVYPNPATDMLNVTLSKGNTNVAIYNSVGIKMEEIRVEGTHHVFNVSNYSSGLYFVKANNAVVKFVK